MNKKLGRLLHPSAGVFFAMLMVFAAAAVLMEYYILAIGEFAVTAILLIGYLIHRKYRLKEIQKYLENALENNTGKDGAQPPFPMAAIRLEDNVIVYANDEFIKLTGFEDYLKEHTIGSVVPGFATDWLSDGKSQYPYDVHLHGRRYRVYGTSIYADDPKSTRLGVLYYTDLTELNQVRD